MATVANEEFAIEWRTVGLARIVNASSMAGRVSHQHWFATVARHLLQPDGPNFVVTYAQMNIVFWTVGDGAGLLRSLTSVGSPRQRDCLYIHDTHGRQHCPHSMRITS